eukprot:7466490-Pyramimonas_sp.AAC.1
MDVARKDRIAHQRARACRADRGAASSWTSRWTNNEPSYSVDDGDDDSIVDCDDASPSTPRARPKFTWPSRT